jgi:hypothetical protein
MNPSMVLANIFNALIPIILQIIPSLQPLHGKVGGFTNPFILVKKNLGYNLYTNINDILV